MFLLLEFNSNLGLCKKPTVWLLKFIVKIGLNTFTRDHFVIPINVILPTFRRILYNMRFKTIIIITYVT